MSEREKRAERRARWDAEKKAWEESGLAGTDMIGVDLGDRLIRLQVKATRNPRPFPQERQRHVTGYVWGIRQGKRGVRAYAPGSVDGFVPVRRSRYQSRERNERLAKLSRSSVSMGSSNGPKRVAIADPPYPGCAHLYRDHPDYAGEVDHERLLVKLDDGYDGWLLHTSSVALPTVLGYAEMLDLSDYRVMAWVKPFAAFKANVPVAYAWEPVIVKPCRKPEVTGREVMRDWIAESITMERGLTGAKPERVCMWAFEMLGLQPDDELVDLFPGTGAVTRAWEKWRNRLDFTQSEATQEELSL